MMVAIGGLSILDDDGKEKFKIPDIEYSGMEERHVLAVEKSYLCFLASLLECGIANALEKGEIKPEFASYLRQAVPVGSS